MQHGVRHLVSPPELHVAALQRVLRCVGNAWGAARTGCLDTPLQGGVHRRIKRPPVVVVLFTGHTVMQHQVGLCRLGRCLAACVRIVYGPHDPPWAAWRLLCVGRPAECRLRLVQELLQRCLLGLGCACKPCRVEEQYAISRRCYLSAVHDVLVQQGAQWQRGCGCVHRQPHGVPSSRKLPLQCEAVMGGDVQHDGAVVVAGGS